MLRQAQLRKRAQRKLDVPSVPIYVAPPYPRIPGGTMTPASPTRPGLFTPRPFALGSHTDEIEDSKVEPVMATPQGRRIPLAFRLVATKGGES
jgi:hypothetical protein